MNERLKANFRGINPDHKPAHPLPLGQHNQIQIAEVGGRAAPWARILKFLHTFYRANKHRAPKTPMQRYVAIYVTLLMIVAIGIQFMQPFMSAQAYSLTPEAKELVGESRDDTAKYLSFDAKAQNYRFSVPQEATVNTVHGGRNASAYTTHLPLDASEGITYTDTATKIDITVAPSFRTGTGQKVDGDYMVYPSGATQLVYTHKFNGLKEDIIIPEAKYAKDVYGFDMLLPSGVEARLDRDGNIGIYSADTSLYGNISFGSDVDREKIAIARETAKKTNLLAIIPAPIVKDARGTNHNDKAKFTLESKGVMRGEIQQDVPEEVKEKLAINSTKNKYQLSIITNDLKSLRFPISVDPTITSTSGSDLGTGDLDGTEVDQTNNLIRRGAVTGGNVGTWTTDTDAIPGDGATKMAITYYNGRLYAHGGFNSNTGATHATNVLYMASIDATTGNIGSWTSAGILGTASTHDLMFYNGYVYRTSDSAGGTGNIIYAKVNSDGTINTQQTTSAYTPGRRYVGALIHNGYMYISGGCSVILNPNLLDVGVDCASYESDVRYAKLQGDGTISAWSSAGPNFTQSRGSHNFVAYNGYMYVFGGNNDDGPSYDFNQVQITSINANGTINAWSTTTNTISNSPFSGAVAYKGYLYLTTSVVRFAPIHTNGALGAWQTTTAYMGSGRSEAALTIANDFLYFGTGITYGTPNTFYNTLQYSPINKPGVINPIATTGAMPSNSKFSATAAGNGYLYDTGGCTGAGSASYASCPGNSLSSVVRYGTIAGDGTVTWTTTTSLPAGRWGHAAYVYRDYIYVVGGGTFTGITYSYNGNILIAPINQQNGSVGAWTTYLNKMTATNTAYQSVVAHGDFLYVLGGRSNSGGTSDTKYFPVNSDGTLGTQINGRALPNTQWGSSVTLYGDRIYYTNNFTMLSSVLGADGSIGVWTDLGVSAGGRGEMIQAHKGYLYRSGDVTVRYAKINADGTLGEWVTLSTALNPARKWHGMTSFNDTLYIWSGCSNTTNYDDLTCTSSTSTVSYATFNNGGNGITTAWSTSASAIPEGKGNEAGAALYNGYMYLAAGRTTGGAASTNVYKASLTKTGQIGTWTSVTAFPAGRTNPVLKAYNGRLYAVSGTCANTVLSSTIDANTGNLGSWVTASSQNIPGNLCGLDAEIYKDKLYVIGGYTGGSGAAQCVPSIRYATILADGTLSSWTTNPNSYSTLRNAINAVLYKNFIYVLGGYENNCDGLQTFTRDVEVGIIDETTGVIGPFSQTKSFPVGHHRGGEYGVNGYLYSISGQDEGRSESADSRRAPILANGHLGEWERAGPNLSQSRVDFALLCDGNRFYVLGGNNLSVTPVYYSSIESAALNTVSRVVRYTKLIDFEKGVLPTKLILRGTEADGVVGIRYETTQNEAVVLGNEQNITDQKYDATNASTLNLGASRSISRYLWLIFEIDESLSSTFADDFDRTELTSYDIFFTPNAGARLRGGQTFVGGKDRGLQTTR